MRGLVAAVFLLAFMLPAQARHSHHHRAHYVHHAQRVTHGAIAGAYAGGQGTQIVGGRPSGCPHAYCGCGTSLHIFGRIVEGLNLAANWFRFPRAEPAAGMVAVRNHHVFAIMQNLGNGRVLAYDSNSGGGRTRVHVRSLAGYRVVNPHGGRG